MRVICKYLDRVIKKYNHDNFFFIEIGAHDGIHVDPIHRFIVDHKWNGILVEPVPHLFELLKKNYTDYRGLIFENVAISNNNEKRIFYHLPDIIDGKNMSSIGSFYKDSYIRKKRKKKQLDWWNKKINPNLIKTKVNCLSYQELLRKHNVKRVDMLQIDAEGYDFEVIKQIDFNFAKPKIIHYEHNCLGSDTERSWKYLENNGYKVSRLSSNTLAIGV